MPGVQAVSATLESQQPDETRPTARRRLPPDLLADILLVGSIFIVWRLTLFALTYVGSRVVPLAANGGFGAIGEGKSFDYWLSWAQWDGGWFLIIADGGYTANLRSPAFFPVYPTLMRLLSYPLDSSLVAGLLISNVAFVTFLLLFFRLVREMKGPDVALTAMLTLVTFPTAYFAAAVYSESLFLLFVIASFYFLRGNALVPASAAAGLAAGTRLVGMAAWLPLALYVLSRRDLRLRTWPRLVAAIALALLPIAAYCAYCWHTFDDPIYFASISADWQRTAAGPIQTFTRFFTDPPPGWVQRFLEPASLFVFLGILALGFRKLPFDWWLFSLVVVLIPLSSGLLQSMPRYVLASIGVFVIAGVFLHDRPLPRLALWLGSIAMQAVLATMYFNGHWTA